MKLSERDEKMITQLKTAIMVQKQVFQKKLDTFEAVQRNFKILQKLCSKQKDEFGDTMRHTTQIEGHHTKLLDDHHTLQKEHEFTAKENIKFKKKERQYNMALEEKVELQLKYDDAEKALIKTRRKVKEMETIQKVLEAESQQVKTEIVNYIDKNAKLLDHNNRLDKMAREQIMKIKDLDQKVNDQKLTIDSKSNTVIILENSLQQMAI